MDTFNVVSPTPVYSWVWSSYEAQESDGVVITGVIASGDNEWQFYWHGTLMATGFSDSLVGSDGATYQRGTYVSSWLWYIRRGVYTLTGYTW